MRCKIFTMGIVSFVVSFLAITVVWSEDRLTLFVGAASKPPVEEIVKLFQKETGVKVGVTFGGSGYVLSQMILAKKGDIYFPGSSDYMERAKREGFVYPDTEKIVVYLVPAINVQRGNPKNIKGLDDLCRPGVRVAIANPENVCVGEYAVEIIEKSLTPSDIKKFKKNIVNYMVSCEKTMMAVALKSVDAVIGWRVFEHWNPDLVETIPLKTDELVRVGYIPIAISQFTQNRELAQKFIDFVLSEEGSSVFKKYKYFTLPEEAFNWIGQIIPVGGEYQLPKGWVKK
ncbi:MAG: molybdate ABC transporter substrate-binding protein [Candidatus Loosdrechtia sp.]|uniref:molybdate ABC transporter substrate-binding protein n=1 Tax=Candidatus Loosdrechtia sp. TaxID=3101272 RepID=UPI003A7547B2|nr:MAG: molybdate ABC transporter substrate-binding protein [Candidatus Jettenia sp. AMX2]